MEGEFYILPHYYYIFNVEFALNIELENLFFNNISLCFVIADEVTWMDPLCIFY